MDLFQGFLVLPTEDLALVPHVCGMSCGNMETLLAVPLLGFVRSADQESSWCCRSGNWDSNNFLKCSQLLQMSLEAERSSPFLVNTMGLMPTLCLVHLPFSSVTEYFDAVGSLHVGLAIIFWLGQRTPLPNIPHSYWTHIPVFCYYGCRKLLLLLVKYILGVVWLETIQKELNFRCICPFMSCHRK